MQQSIAPAGDDATANDADRLARRLIRHLGVAGAVRTCRENHWDGILMAVRARAAQGSTA